MNFREFADSSEDFTLNKENDGGDESWVTL